MVKRDGRLLGDALAATVKSSRSMLYCLWCSLREVHCLTEMIFSAVGRGEFSRRSWIAEVSEKVPPLRALREIVIRQAVP